MASARSYKEKLSDIFERSSFILGVSGLFLLIGMVVPAIAQERMPEISVDKMSAAQKKAAEEFLAGRGKPVTGPFIPLLRSPEVLVRAKALGDYLRFKSALAPKLREFATLITAREWTQQFEWYHHSEFATEAGLNQAIIKAVAEGRRPEGMSDGEEIIYDFCTELHRNHSVSDTTYNKAIAAFGEQGTIDLVSLTGYYTFVSMILNVNRTGPPKGVAPLLAPFP
ncbi:MAG: carboxymuconolactone decarboxylase family protein [Candidatus Sulfotelmatobacter sp.]|jgi:4-carboxymuconolactone decarboxylase